MVNYVLPVPDGTAPAYDAVAEDWFDSPEAMQAAFASPEGQRAGSGAEFLPGGGLRLGA